MEYPMKNNLEDGDIISIDCGTLLLDITEIVLTPFVSEK